jgi:hypothetical protein
MQYAHTSDLYTFIATPWPTLGRENSATSFDNPVDMWNQKNRAYLSLAEKFQAINLRYETLLEDPRMAIELVASKLSIKLKEGFFTNINHSTSNDQISFLEYKNYYLNEVWLEKLTDRAITLINERLDQDLVAELGYRTIT